MMAMGTWRSCQKMSYFDGRTVRIRRCIRREKQREQKPKKCLTWGVNIQVGLLKLCGAAEISRSWARQQEWVRVEESIVSTWTCYLWRGSPLTWSYGVGRGSAQRLAHSESSINGARQREGGKQTQLNNHSLEFFMKASELLFKLCVSCRHFS